MQVIALNEVRFDLKRFGVTPHECQRRSRRFLHHITELTFKNNGATVMTVHCSTAVSRDPYFSFSFGGAKAGDTLSVHWVDNKGESDSTETVLS